MIDYDERHHNLLEAARHEARHCLYGFAHGLPATKASIRTNGSGETIFTPLSWEHWMEITREGRIAETQYGMLVALGTAHAGAFGEPEIAEGDAAMIEKLCGIWEQLPHNSKASAQTMQARAKAKAYSWCLASHGRIDRFAAILTQRPYEGVQLSV